MTSIDRLSSMDATAAAGVVAGSSARSLAGSAMAEIGARVLAWSGAIGGGQAGSGAWAAQTGVATGFRADPATLAQGGDVYGLNELAREIGAQTGATPTQEGELRRAMEGFTREAAVQFNGLAGAAGDRQVAGVRDALTAALAGEAPDGIDGVIARFGHAEATLATARGA